MAMYNFLLLSLAYRKNNMRWGGNMVALNESALLAMRLFYD